MGTQSIVKSVETGPISNAATLGETNVSNGTRRGARSTGKKGPREIKFGLRTQQAASITRLRTVNLSPNTVPKMKSTLNAPRFHIKNVTGLRIPTVLMFPNNNVTMCHMKTAMMFNDKSASKNRGKIVRTSLDKNAKMFIQRYQDKWLSKYPFVYAEIVAKHTMTQMDSLTQNPSLILGLMTIMIPKKT